MAPARWALAPSREPNGPTNFILSLLFIALFYFSPGFSTPLFYKQTDELNFSKQAIGNLGVFSGAFAILATILYGQLIKRVHIRILLFIGVATAAAGTLLYLIYVSHLFNLYPGTIYRLSEW